MEFRICNASVLLATVLMTVGNPVSAQNQLGPVAGEYLISGELGGNQVRPHLDITPAGGYVVWQDDAMDADGTSIGAQRLNSNLSGSLSPIRINSESAGNQEKPRIAMSADGGAAVVWQSGQPGRQDIFLRILTAEGTFVGPETQVNQFSTDFQINPDIAILPTGELVVVWDSYGQDGHLRAVNGRLYQGDGTPIGDEFRVNQSTHLNQRNAAVTAVGNGGFIVAWISERLLGQDQFGGAQFASDVMVRRYTLNGTPSGDEERINSMVGICANPALVADESGGFIAAWSQSSSVDREGGWNVRAASYRVDGTRISDEYQVNTHHYGDQFRPVLAGRGSVILAAWTSVGQDGSYEGVFGRVLGGNGEPFGDEFKINTQTFNRQLHPSVEMDTSGRFLVVWASYANGGSRFNLHGQRLASSAPLPTLPAPFVNALSAATLAVSWPALAGYDVVQYEVFVDNTSPQITTNQNLKIENLSPASSHTIRLGYRLRDGRTGDLSAAATASTWGSDDNFDGLPDDWQQEHWGTDSSQWPSITSDSDNDGANNRAEFLAGTNPLDSDDVLTVNIENSGGAIWIEWNTRPGFVYTVDRSVDGATWQRHEKARFAPEFVDRTHLGSDESGMFRVVRMR